MSTGEVIQLAPGSQSVRQDWSPIAQVPDRWGVIAHTPNPNAYHNVGGRTMLPRAVSSSPTVGGSRGFDTRPGVVNVDPVDPVRGTGGITVDLERVSKRDFAEASMAAGGDPTAAWAMAAAKQTEKRATMTQPSAAYGFSQYDSQPPQLQPGYTVPRSTPGGAQIAVQGAMLPMGGMGQIFPQSAQMQPSLNPSVRAKENPMAVPQMMESAPWEGSQPPPQYMQPQQPQQPLPQYATQPQQPYMPQQQPYMPQQQPYMPQQQPPQYMQPLPPPPPPPGWVFTEQGWVYQPQTQQPVVEAKSTDVVVLQALRNILDELKDMKSDNKQPGKDREVEQSEPEPEPEDEDRQAWEKKPALQGKRKSAEFKNSDSYQELDMPWLAKIPVKPTLQVVFTQNGNMFRTKYHAAYKRGVCLSLIYDSRYDGDQFVPGVTGEEDTIRVQIPSRELDSEAFVFDYHQRIGCLDVINLILADKDMERRQHGPPLPEEFDPNLNDMTRGRQF